jgi:hypothetical protein
LIKNGKYFVPVTRTDLTFKDLFKLMVASGAGLPVDSNGVPLGVWTPERLAEEISNLDGNDEGVELRTVQLWFQDNDKGISPKNIHWLARVFGCGDRLAISEWQAELVASNRRLSQSRKNGQTINVDTEIDQHSSNTHNSIQQNTGKGFNLAQWCESVFVTTSLNVPSTVFAIGSALIFLSYLCGNHSFVYQTPEGYGKQIGYVWTTNWTLIFTVFFPAFFVFSGATLNYWKSIGRTQLMLNGDPRRAIMGWRNRVEMNGYTFNLVFILLIVFAGGVQWISVRLFPLLVGEADYTTDWGSLALEHPEAISVIEAIGFTGLAYLTMCLFFFAFYAVLILLFTMAQDFDHLSKKMRRKGPDQAHSEISRIGDKLVVGIFRCSILGVMSVIVMKLQGSYMESYGTNILSWYLNDMMSIFNQSIVTDTVVGWGTPNHVASLLCALAVCFTFAMGIFYVPGGEKSKISRKKLVGIFGLLFGAYLTIGLFDGFTILLTIAMATSTLSLCYPNLTFNLKTNQETEQRVF